MTDDRPQQTAHDHPVPNDHPDEPRAVPPQESNVKERAKEGKLSQQL
ncbi:MAG: hypothetical protein QF473_24145 [Planctomycetota bacterium]|nr:hypothetical protein [Planctomycetota bacterium]